MSTTTAAVTLSNGFRVVATATAKNPIAAATRAVAQVTGPFLDLSRKDFRYCGRSRRTVVDTTLRS